MEDKSKAIEGLKAVATRNNTSHQRAVTALIRATGNVRAIKVNKERGTNG